MELGLELERELSPARYLRRHSQEFPACPNDRAVPAAIEAAMALEDCDLGRARRHWRMVVAAARSAGRRARESGIGPRRLMGDVERLRTAMETVLFDGRLPPDLAACAARLAGKMCTRVLEHALCTYWEAGDAAAGPAATPSFQAYGPEPRITGPLGEGGESEPNPGAARLI